ncbi:thiol reductase thioredoxin [Cupriavidus sp. TA19]|uniref:thioredoxin family protein n=1 Tax=Cupriavidus sp. TA19 TaxID=701108 RepID=UPI002729464E|nr:thioredoxin family protein [Cupriavidus sp. TA19]GLC94279.1 thiol reductase thioredoxin [Cupriavidus sp. TA19]
MVDNRASGLSRSEVDALAGVAVLDFGARWCGIGRGSEAVIRSVFTLHPDLAHIKIEDGPGLPLGRSNRVRMWPTLIFLRDGKELARLVRPTSARHISEAVARLYGPASDGGKTGG